MLGGQAGEDVSGRERKGHFPLAPRGVPPEGRSQGRALARFKDQAFPKQGLRKKIRFSKNAICGQFFKRNDVVPVGLVVCCFWEVILGKGCQHGFSQVIILN